MRETEALFREMQPHARTLGLAVCRSKVLFRKTISYRHHAEDHGTLQLILTLPYANPSQSRPRFHSSHTAERAVSERARRQRNS